MQQAELDRLVSVLEEYPDLQIRLESHTDSRGADDFRYGTVTASGLNQLSSILLVKESIRTDLEHVGFGETQLVNKCEDGVNCTEEEHAENRRTVVEILKAKVTRRSKGNTLLLLTNKSLICIVFNYFLVDEKGIAKFRHPLF